MNINTLISSETEYYPTIGGEGEDALEENIKLYGLLQPISIFVYSLKKL